MAELRIVHDHENGTLLEGSRKGDGVYEIARRHGFSWFPSIKVIGIRGSCDKPAQKWRINAAAEALRAAGHTVTVEIDDEWRPAVEREAARAERVEERVERYDERAGRAAAGAFAARDARRAISDGIPFGQPKMPGHHSYARACRDEDRMDALDRRQYAAADKAEHLAGRAEGARRNEAHKHDPRAITRRVEKLQADLRGVQRSLDGYQRQFLNGQGKVYQVETYPPATGERAERRRDEAKRLDEEIAHLQGKLAEHDVWGRKHFAKGDLVNVGGRWCEVARVNLKSVSVHNRWQWSTAGGRPEPVTFDNIYGRRRDGMQVNTPSGEPWPVDLADRVASWHSLVASARLAHQHPWGSAERRSADQVGYAQRLVVGLSITASDAELGAFPKPDIVDARRQRAAACLAVYERLQAGEPVPDVAASLTVAAVTPAWQLPDREPEDRRSGPTGSSTADQLPMVQPGDLVKGFYDRGFGGRNDLVRGFCGPVVHVSEVNHRREAGDWVTIRLADGTERDFQTHQWLAVYPAGSW